jgi:hypothetical protein
MERGLSLLVLFSLLCGGAAHGLDLSGSPRPRHRVFFDSLSALQLNPEGAETYVFLGYRYRLFQSDSILLRNSFVGIKGLAMLNPAFARLGGAVEIEPLAALTLRVIYQHRLYFGTVNMLLDFDSPYQEHHDDLMQARSEADENYATHGTQLTLQAVLKAKAGPIALLNELSFHYFDISLRHAGRLLYVNLFDTLAPDEGWTVVNSGHLFYMTDFGLVAGIRHTLVHALYPEHLLDQRGNPNTPNHRLGPMLAWVLSSGTTTFQNPTVIGILNWWINSRYRSGQRVHNAVPYGVIAFQFEGDLWTGQ